MQLPSLRPIKANSNGLSEVPYEMEEEEDQEPNFDIPQSREEKPAAYPNGPIQIYPSGVFLYFEPTAEQACTFDVIINVASEVKNPFTMLDSESQKDIDARRIDGPPAENPDFALIPERSHEQQQTSSPTTPKATPVLETTQPVDYTVNGKSYKTPEYIHMPWEHNTDIVSDLYKLVKTMDERVQHNKRVLVHCQCGVSRSASLIVAYGLYKNPGMSVQEAYDIVKKRSKWIGPNMNLIMQLQEFRNGLLKANESRPFHNQPYGRRSAGLPTGISVATNRHSPFDRDMPTGSRTPRTAPLPPDNDVNMQRASTGNMIAISPGPLSAPSGSSLFSPGFRQSWAASQTQFDLSPRSSPSATPYVDPKGHVVPVLAITDDSSTAEAPLPLTEDVQPNDQEIGLESLPVPNFSRQLPFRTACNDIKLDRPRTSPNLNELHAPLQPLGFGALRSPAVATFSIPQLVPEHPPGMPLKSPLRPEFNMNPWPKGYDLDSQSSIGSDSPPPPPMSPKTFEFNIPHLHRDEQSIFDPAPHGQSPRSSIGTLSPKPKVAVGARVSQTFDVISPIKTKFPTDIFGHTNDIVEQELTSPRATEFHMTPLKPRVADEDPFGLASPRHFEFPTKVFRLSGAIQREAEAEAEARRPSFQAILPPSNLLQPESINGFASLNGTAQALPVVFPPGHWNGETDDRIDSVSPLGSDSDSTKSSSPNMHALAQDLPVTPKSSEQALLSTPPKQLGLRTRFSTPNLREQRKLHKLQTEMEAMLPNRTSHRPQAADDLDALMSPRAEEFTRNPFHFELHSPTDENSPASSNETIKDSQNRTDWTEKRQWTPQKSLEEDPRSPVQTGSSPIVRNIWDVL